MKNLLSIFKDSTQHFEGQEVGEDVVLLLRRHRFVLLFPIFVFLLAALVPIAVFSLYSKDIIERGLFDAYLFISSLWYMGFWLLTFYFLTLYSLNTIIITNKRIVDSDQHGFFNRKTSELHVHRIQDVSVHTNGVIETFLDFGDIVVQTAAVEKQFIFHQIGSPEKVKDVIMKIVGSQYSGVKQYEGAVHNSKPGPKAGVVL